MYTEKREVVKKINNQLEQEIVRKELTIEEQLKEKNLKRESIR